MSTIHKTQDENTKKHSGGQEPSITDRRAMMHVLEEQQRLMRALELELALVRSQQ